MSAVASLSEKLLLFNEDPKIMYNASFSPGGMDGGVNSLFITPVSYMGFGDSHIEFWHNEKGYVAVVTLSSVRSRTVMFMPICRWYWRHDWFG
ncbi:MAG: hypothetical protein M2R45_00503 [Verrucomicrobia subdivision 3 bacterium]|nr:hypothetical protein [Limisphaerales bacterium]MCS1413619.1 hypothetical protein [Limisphaerales bacterium]